MNEVQMLVNTPCKNEVLKRAFLFSILTGLRHGDIQTLKWKQIQQTSKGTWQAVVVQQKTKVPDYKPVTQQALQLCGERPSDEESFVFEGLTDASWISRPLKVRIVPSAGGGTNNEQGWRDDKNKDNQRNEPFYKTSKRRR